MFSRFVSYYSFGRNAFLKMLAYRLRYYTGIVTYLLFVSVHYFIWLAIFSEREPGATINGFSMPEMVTYVSIGWIARSLYFSNIDEHIDDLVRTGQVSIFLLRPVNFQLMMISQAAGESIFRLLFFTLPIGAVITFIYPVGLPETFGDALWFTLATIASFLVLALMNFLVGMLAFRFKSTQGIMRAKYYLVQLLSGLLLPLAFFPGWFREFLDYLPFKIIASVPLQFYLGKIAEDERLAVGFSMLFWVVLLFILGQLAWRKAIVRLTLQGG